MQRSVSLIFCGRWNTSQLFVLLQEGNSRGMEQQQHEKASEPASVSGERGRISSLVPEARVLCFSDNDNNSLR